MAPHLRRGEIIAGLGGLVLLVGLFAVPWFQVGSSGAGHTDASGWTSLPTLRWLILVASLSGVALAVLQATRRAPALPVTTSIIATALGLLTTLALIIRIPTDGASPLAGAFVGLVATAAITAGAFLSLRQEDGWRPDAEHPIERISLRPPERDLRT
ncbi:MAG TPA: hypothetical protein VHX62_10830 [Solirubrobacteraceae bacterium]|nr:hypothetical protein [Solirubrobacteraceae bacterium]